MQQWCHRNGVQQGCGKAFVAQAQCVVPEFGLMPAKQAGKADQCTHIAQCFVRDAFTQAVVFGQMLQFEAGALAILTLPPHDAIGA